MNVCILYEERFRSNDGWKTIHCRFWGVGKVHHFMYSIVDLYWSWYASEHENTQPIARFCSNCMLGTYVFRTLGVENAAKSETIVLKRKCLFRMRLHNIRNRIQIYFSGSAQATSSHLTQIQYSVARLHLWCDCILFFFFSWPSNYTKCHQTFTFWCTEFKKEKKNQIQFSKWMNEFTFYRLLRLWHFIAIAFDTWLRLLHAIYNFQECFFSVKCRFDIWFVHLNRNFNRKLQSRYIRRQFDSIQRHFTIWVVEQFSSVDFLALAYIMDCSFFPCDFWFFFRQLSNIPIFVSIFVEEIALLLKDST